MVPPHLSVTLPYHLYFCLCGRLSLERKKWLCYNLRCWKLVSLWPQQWNLILSYCPVLLKFQNITAVLEIHFKMDIYRTWKRKSHQDPWQHFWKCLTPENNMNRLLFAQYRCWMFLKWSMLSIDLVVCLQPIKPKCVRSWINLHWDAG